MNLSDRHNQTAVNRDVNSRVNTLAEQVQASRVVDVLDKLDKLHSDNNGNVFHVSLETRDSYDKQHISGEHGVPYPSFEIEVEYSANKGSKYDLDEGFSISRAPKMSIFFASQYKKDNLTGVEIPNNRTFMVSYDSAHLSSVGSTASHEFDMHELANEGAVMAAIYKFSQSVAPDRAAEIREIITSAYDGNLNPDDVRGISNYNPADDLGIFGL